MINDLKDRTKRFAVDVVRFCSTLNGKSEFRIISNQLLRAGTSVGANYRAACRLKSKADFIKKLPTVEDEADEFEYQFELLESLAAAKSSELIRLKDRAHPLVTIMIQSKKTARASVTLVRTADSLSQIRHSPFVIRHS